MILSEDEERLIELANELSKKTTGYELSESEEYSLLKMYRSNNQPLLPKIIMRRNQNECKIN